MVGLSRVARRANLRDAFAATEALSGAAVLLVDDVVTTGSTLGSAAGACRAQGARAVYAVTLAREE
jgi:predicted amidophosphoribosyltransferase